MNISTYVYDKSFDKKAFYSLMGEFFAEKTYQKMFPYLSNEEGRIWLLLAEDDQVIGFTTMINRKTHLDLGYTFGKSKALERQLLDKRFDLVAELYPHSPLKAALQDKKGIEYWLDRGFEIERETTNYFFVYKEEKNEH